MKDVAHAETEKGVGEPGCETYEPYPCCLSHHHSLQERSCSQGEQAQFDGLVLHY